MNEQTLAMKKLCEFQENFQGVKGIQFGKLSLRTKFEVNDFRFFFSSIQTQCYTRKHFHKFQIHSKKSGNSLQSLTGENYMRNSVCEWHNVETAMSDVFEPSRR